MISPVFLLSLGSGLVWILPALLFLKYIFFIYICVCLPMRVYVHQVYTDVHGGQKALNTLKLDLQMVVSQLMQVLGTEAWFSARTISTLNPINITPAPTRL